MGKDSSRPKLEGVKTIIHETGSKNEIFDNLYVRYDIVDVLNIS